MTRSVALLRGINVGKSTRVPMADLRALVEELGGTDVVSYVNSGNLVYSGTVDAAQLQARIHDDFGVATRIVVVDADLLERIIEQMPYTGDDHAKLGVVFMNEVPRDVAFPDLGVERIELGEHAVYQDLPDGYAGSKLTPAFWKKAFPPEATARNWRTVLKLRELVRGND